MFRNLGAITALLLSVCISGGAYATEYLVKYKNNAGLVSILETARVRLNVLRITDRHERGSFMKVDISKVDEARVLVELLANPNIEWVVPNFKLYTLSAPIRASTLQPQWAIAKVQAEKAWTRAGNRGKHDVTVAVIDTGIDYRHKNLAPNMVPGFDFKDNDSDPMDETGSANPGHGTHCAGIIGATGLIDDGTVGMGPDLSIMPIRFLGADGSGDLNNAIKAIDYAIEHNVQVISASWGAAVPRSQATPLIEALQRADAKGVIFVAAAANDGKSNDSRDVFPANANTENMISVAASGESDAKPKWSNFGRAMVHLASPGEDILSTLPGDKFGKLSGTSMATPLVSGLVGFLKSQDMALTGKQIRALLQTTGAKVSIETACNCRVDAFNAVDTLVSKKPWLVPTAASLAENDSVSLRMMNGQGTVSFVSSNPAILSVDASGMAKALSKGSATVTATDGSGAKAESLDFLVGVVTTPPPGGDCPLGEASLCQAACQIMPTLPFCSK